MGNKKKRLLFPKAAAGGYCMNTLKCKVDLTQVVRCRKTLNPPSNTSKAYYSFVGEYYEVAVRFFSIFSSKPLSRHKLNVSLPCELLYLSLFRIFS